MIKEQIPQEMQIAYNCDYVVWDSDKCCFLCIAEDHRTGSWVTNEMEYGEFVCAKADAEEHEEDLYTEYLMELEEEWCQFKSLRDEEDY